MDVKQRFLDYISFDTQSEEEREEVPSTKKQFALAKHLVEELNQMGASDVTLTEHCYIYATIPATVSEEKKLPVLGFIAHMDTSPALIGANVSPKIIEQYDGTEIVLN